MIAILQHLNPAGAQNGLALALRTGCFGAARSECAAAAAAAMRRQSSSRWQTSQLACPAAFKLQQHNFLHISAPCAALQHQEIKPDGGLYLDGLLFMKQPWKAVLVDAAGTLLVPRERTADVYLRYGSKYGVNLTEQEILERFRSAYNTPWGHSSLRYVGDGRPFWRFIVEQSTGCAHQGLFEELYEYYLRPEAWSLAPGAVAALRKLRAAGVRLAVVSNFDTRLRPILAALEVDKLFDAVVVSAEVGAEKPNPIIFEAALQSLGLRPSEVVHVGDDRRNDCWGARDAGITAWLWGVDVRSFDEVAKKALKGPSAYAESDSDDDEPQGVA